uniref:Phosphatidic acid phosphatase type 2/haloperoxidase domain-containing protein n=1 Tax=Fibrocapsa japonica TaxID=94617 RepID=A0A7S2Y483_9STRA|mmetsp:Transcript_7348/g.11058  ORF Transcript_7348/g.11058 Transcript_7348/m.11058 type:complete len:306 (+) Transcript_7348:6-923(+)
MATASRSEYSSFRQRWENLVEWDLDMIWIFHRYISESRFCWIFEKLTSNSPLADVSLLTWVAFIVALSEFGFPYLWICSGNLIVAQVLRFMLGCERPFNYDRQLRPTTDRHEFSYGFPSLETHMAVVVFGFICVKCWTWMWWPLVPLFVAFTVFVGMTRVYSYARFVHQVALSWVTGGLGLGLGILAWAQLAAWKFRYQNHIYWLAVVGAAFGVVVGLWIENGDTSRFGLGVPRSEYVRVLSNIVSTPPPPGAVPIDSSASTQPHRRRRPKMDSFHHLQKTLQKRSDEQDQIRQRLRSSLRNMHR